MEAAPWPPRSRRSALFLIRVSSLAGVAISLYLVHQHIEYATTGALNSPLCSVNTFFDCERVEASGYSAIAGIPIASLGLGYFALLSLASWLISPGGSVSSRRAWQGIFGWLTIPAIVVAWGLAMLSAVVIDSFCLGCTAMYGAILLSALAPIIASPGEYLFALKHAPRSVLDWLGQKLRDRPGRRPRLVAGAVILLIASLLNLAAPAWLIHRRGRVEQGAREIERIEAFFRQPVVELKPSAEGMTQGDPDSGVSIVVFTDFRCRFCKKFDGELKEMLARRPGRYFLSYKHFPLSRECNPVMKNASFDHEQACRMALMAEAMGDMGFFEDWGGGLYLDEPDVDLYPTLKSIANQSGQDMNHWAARSMGDDIRERVERDIEEGLRLGLTGVPAVFINGRQLPSTDPGRVEEVLDAVELANRD